MPARLWSGRRRAAIVRARSTAGSRGKDADLRYVGALAAPFILGFTAVPANAQVSGSLDVESDYRLRGYPLSAGRPVATAQIGYDDASGIYLNLSATGEIDRDDLLFLGVQGNIGYARRLNPVLSINTGIARTQFRSRLCKRATQLHRSLSGLASGPVSARVYYSPDYDRADVSSLYAESGGDLSAGDELAAERPSWNAGLSCDAGAISARLCCPF